MNKTEFLESIKQFPEHKFARLVYAKPEKLLKKDRVTKEQCPYKDIFKLVSLIVGIGYSYKTGVNNRREKEDLEKDFVPKELPWGEWVEGSNVLITHKDNMYIRFYTDYANNPIKNQYIDLDGNLYQYEELKNYLQKKQDNKSQGLDNPVKPITINADNVEYFKCGEIEYGQIQQKFKEIFELI